MEESSSRSKGTTRIAALPESESDVVTLCAELAVELSSPTVTVWSSATRALSLVDCNCLQTAVNIIHMAKAG